MIAWLAVLRPVCFVLFLCALSLCIGCAALPILAQLAQGAQYLGTLISVAESGSNIFFARHPNADLEASVREQIFQTRRALEMYEAGVAAGEKPSKENLLRAWAALRLLLADLGVLAATPPEGGAETEAPAPQPFELPTAAELETWL